MGARSFSRILSGRTVLLLVLGLGQVASAEAAYIEAAQFPFADVIHGPPALDSPEGQAELATLLILQEYREAEDVKRVREDNLLDLQLAFADVLGDWFVNAKLPIATKLLTDVTQDINGVNNAAKNRWNRVRPFAQNSAIKPCVRLPTNQSYPSGHTCRSLAEGLLLADLCPDLRNEILARSQRIGKGRVLAGVHFPSDVRDAALLAEAVYRSISAAPQFQCDLAAARMEVDQARKRDMPTRKPPDPDAS